MLTDFFLHYLTHFSYGGIFIVLTFVGYVIPIPEEVLLMIVGYLGSAEAEIINIYTAWVLVLVAVTLGDNILYHLTLRHAAFIERLKNKVTPSIMRRYENLMREHPGKAIFLIRFIPGLRFLAPVLAGTLGIAQKTFQLYNTLSVFVTVSLFIFLGYHFHATFAALLTQVKEIRHLIAIALAVIVGIFIFIFDRKRFMAKINGNK